MVQHLEYSDEILLVMEVVVFCTNSDPELRSSSGDALTILLQIPNMELMRSGPVSEPEESEPLFVSDSMG